MSDELLADDDIESGISDADRPETPQIDPPEDDR
jgi:hypothetical protein